MREFNTREAEGNYSITFETDDRKAFEKVQKLCRMLIDGKDCEAIPVEWIKRWLSASRSSGLSLDAYIMLHDWEVMENGKSAINDQQEKNINGESDAHQTKKCTKVVADDVDRCVDTFLRRVYTDLLNAWESTHKDASDNNIVPYEIQEINPDKER